MQSTPDVVSAQPRSVSIAQKRGLGIAQIIIGALSIPFGIIGVAVLNQHWPSYLCIGIWGGAWIFAGGIIGVSSAAHPINSCLNKANRVFAIVSSIIAFAQSILFFLLMFQYIDYTPRRECHLCGYCICGKNTTGVATYAILTLVMATEIVISMRVLCKGSWVVVQQHQAHIVPSSVMVQSSGVTTSTYPAGYPMSGGMTVAYSAPVSYVNQGYTQAYTTAPPGGNPQMAYITCAGQMQPANPTAMTYNQPGGAEKQQESDAPPLYDDML